MNTKEIQIGDVIEMFNCTGSSDRATERTYIIDRVTKTLAKSGEMRFNRVAEQWQKDGEYLVKHVDERRWSVNGHRLLKTE